MRRSLKLILSFVSVNEISSIISPNSLFFLVQFIETRCELLIDAGAQKIDLGRQVMKSSFVDLAEVDLFLAISAYYSTSAMRNALSISLKFLSCIALLIFARGGIPRFRFDYLTKLG